MIIITVDCVYLNYFYRDFVPGDLFFSSIHKSDNYINYTHYVAEQNTGYSRLKVIKKKKKPRC